MVRPTRFESFEGIADLPLSQSHYMHKVLRQSSSTVIENSAYPQPFGDVF
jgi:hypothetical protein